MNDVPEPDAIEDSDDVLSLLDDVSPRDIENIQIPTGEAIWIFFEAGRERYRLEINFFRGHLWLHHETKHGPETIWKNKRKRRGRV